MKLNLIHVWKNKGKIAEGVANAIFKKEHVEEIANERLAACMKCENIDKEGSNCGVPGTQPCCSLCGCSLAFKTRSLSSACDIDVWSAAVTQEEEDLINQNLK